MCCVFEKGLERYQQQPETKSVMVNEYHEKESNNMSIERSQEGSGVQVWVLLEYEFSNAPGVPHPSLVTQEICSERVDGVQGDKMICRRGFQELP